MSLVVLRKQPWNMRLKLCEVFRKYVAAYMLLFLQFGRLMQTGVTKMLVMHLVLISSVLALRRSLLLIYPLSQRYHRPHIWSSCTWASVTFKPCNIACNVNAAWTTPTIAPCDEVATRLSQHRRQKDALKRALLVAFIRDPPGRRSVSNQRSHVRASP
jgi:hypothetical protein